MEWHYKNTPYMYCFNNPMKYIDPDGNFDTKFGAWFWKILHGGGTIGKDRKTGEYFVSQDKPNTTEGNTVVVTSKRNFDWHGRTQGQSQSSDNQSKNQSTEDEKSNDSQNGGINMVSKNSPGWCATKTLDPNTQTMESEDLLLMIGNADAGPFESGSLDAAKAADAAKDAIENADPNKSDTPPSNTDNKGQPLQDAEDEGCQDATLNMAEHGWDTAWIAGRDTFAKELSGKVRKSNTFNKRDSKWFKKHLPLK